MEAFVTVKFLDNGVTVFFCPAQGPNEHICVEKPDDEGFRRTAIVAAATVKSMLLKEVEAIEERAKEES